MINNFIKILEWLLFLGLLTLLFVVGSPLFQEKGIISTYVVSSGSMEPTIATGSIAVTYPTAVAEIKQGDIITFASPENPKETIIHRATGIENTDGTLKISTKGDNNENADNWTVSASQIKGKGVFFIPLLGYFINFLKTPMGFIVGLGIPALILAALQVLKIRAGINEEVDRKTQQALSKHAESAKPHSEKVPKKVLKAAAIIGFIIPSLMLSAPPAKALFSAEVTIAGLSIRIAELEPPKLSLELYDNDHKARFFLRNVAEFSEIEYELRYKGKGDKWDALTGMHYNTNGDSEITVADLILGTCSQGECVYTADFSFPPRLHQVFLDVTLRNGDETVILKTKEFAPKK